MFQAKIEGQICDGCGGKYVKNPKTGKIFCKNKCWLKKSTNEPKTEPPQFLKPDPIVDKPQIDAKPDWDTINDKKRKDIAEMNAKNNATLLLAHGQIEKEEWEEWCQKVFNYNVE